jgi:hypothetical protein
MGMMSKETMTGTRKKRATRNISSLSAGYRNHHSHAGLTGR